ncbi:MAG: hypothetical protein ACWGPN_01070, partial [Gammaproteobacteria bacterium]
VWIDGENTTVKVAATGQDALYLEIDPDNLICGRIRVDYDRGEWVAYAGDEMFRPRELEEGQYLELDVEGQAVVLEAEPPEPEDGLVPQVPLLSSGDLVPFELRIRREFDDSVFVLSGQANGAIELRDDSEVY